MPTLRITAFDDAEMTAVPDGMSGAFVTHTYFDERADPLQLHLLEPAGGASLRLEAAAIDRLLYVWAGAVAAGGLSLGAGSSVIVERGASLDLTCIDGATRLLVFAESHPAVGAKAGGNVHLLPAERVPRSEFQPGVSGAMHADSACPTCQLWLHENHFSSTRPQPQPDAESGIHSHSEDEIIFVTAGELVFGKRRCPPGTALSIPADSLYSFSPGPQGLSFVNFRAHMPGDIRFKSGHSMSETGFWREHVPRPEYLSPGAWRTDS